MLQILFKKTKQKNTRELENKKKSSIESNPSSKSKEEKEEVI